MNSEDDGGGEAREGGEDGEAGGIGGVKSWNAYEP